MSARRHLDGYTLQFGGPRSPCIRGLEDDPAWFARYHGRNHRIGQLIDGEVDSLAGGPPRFKPLVIVRQVEPGARIRVACWVRRQPLNSEATAAALFAEAADAPTVARIEALVAGGRL